MMKHFTTALFLLAFTINAFSTDTLKVAVYNSPPFGYIDENGNFEGLMVNLWKDIALEMEVNYNFVLIGQITELLDGIEKRKYDIGLGAISITPVREKQVDFSQAVNPSGTGIAISSEKSGASFLRYGKPIAHSVIILVGSLLVILIVLGVVVWLIERKVNPTMFEEKYSGIADGIWWAAVTMTTVGYGDKVPKSLAGRILGIVWIFMGITLFALFTAEASSILTTSKIESHIQTTHDLRRVRVGASEMSSGAEFLKREQITYKKYPSLEEAIDAMLNNQIDAVVSNVPVLHYLNNWKYARKLAISQKYLLKNNMGIALQDKSPYREKIDQILLRKISEPEWQHATYRYFGEE